MYNTELPLLKLETLKIGISGRIMPIEPSEASIQTYCQFEFSGHDQVAASIMLVRTRCSVLDKGYYLIRKSTFCQKFTST